MAEDDLRTIWQQRSAQENNLPTVKSSAEQFNKRSLNLVEKIKNTAQREHRIFLSVAILTLIGLLAYSQFYWLLGLLTFVGLVVWKHEAELLLFNRIQFEDSTLAYLKAVRNILRRFMRNYRIGIAILIPVAVLSGTFFGQWLVNGEIDWTVWKSPSMWLTLSISIGLGILVSRLWLNFWVNTFYGRKMEEMEEMILELEG